MTRVCARVCLLFVFEWVGHSPLESHWACDRLWYTVHAVRKGEERCGLWLDRFLCDRSLSQKTSHHKHCPPWLGLTVLLTSPREAYMWELSPSINGMSFLLLAELSNFSESDFCIKWPDWLIKIHLIILMCKNWRVKISSSNYFTSDQRAKQWRYSHSGITSSGTEKELLLYPIDTERFRDTRKGRNLGESSPATRHAEAAKYSESACRGIKGSAGTMTTTILLVSKSLLYPDTCVFFWLRFWDVCIKEL